MAAQSWTHVERNFGGDSVRSSRAWRPKTSGIGKRSASSTVGRLQTRYESSEIAPMGPIVLDWAEEYLEGLEIRSTDRSTGSGNFMAAHTIQTILVERVAGKRTRASANEFGGPEAD